MNNSFLRDRTRKTGKDRRFSGEELYQLRNLIRIDLLIDLERGVPCRETGGIFRFLCPLCREFQTATNAKTNLARCFRCECNFNPIDMVMIVKGLLFVNSVRYLQQLLEDTAA